MGGGRVERKTHIRNQRSGIRDQEGLAYIDALYDAKHSWHLVPDF